MLRWINFLTLNIRDPKYWQSNTIEGNWINDFKRKPIQTNIHKEESIQEKKKNFTGLTNNKRYRNKEQLKQN